MNAQNIYCRKNKGLDNNVWLFMFILITLSSGLLSFYWIDRNKCISFSINITPNSDTIYTGKTIIFDLNNSPKNVTWNFDDGSESKTGLTVQHQFYQEGRFTVRANVNSACEDAVKEITVVMDPDNINNEDYVFGPDQIEVNKEVEFICKKYATSWDWIIINNDKIKPVIIDEKAKFRFPKEGKYTIQVTLDGIRKQSYYKEIIVIDNRVKPKPTDFDDIKPRFTDQRGDPKKEENTAPEENQINIIGINPISLKDMLNDVITDDSHSLEYFNQFLHYGSKTKVVINEANTKTFNQFYALLRKDSDRKISDVKIDKNEEKKIIAIRVTYIKQS